MHLFLFPIVHALLSASDYLFRDSLSVIIPDTMLQNILQRTRAEIQREKDDLLYFIIIIFLAGFLAHSGVQNKVGPLCQKFPEGRPPIPVETLSAFSFVPGVDFPDRRSFWKIGFLAVMITDTAFYRNPNYHGETDITDKLDFDKMSDLLRGLIKTARDLTDSSLS